MLKWRLVSAAVILSVLIGLLALDYSSSVPGAWLLALGYLAVVLAVGEVIDLLRQSQMDPHPVATYLGSLAVFTSAAVPILWRFSGSPYPADCPMGEAGWLLLGLALGVLLVFCAEMRRFAAGMTSVRITASVFVLVYPALMVSFLALLRLWHSNRWGFTALVSMVVVVKMSDTGAYFVGRWLGRRKLAPRVSPKKTVEGLVGGLLAAGLSAWLCRDLLVPWLVGKDADAGPLWGWLVYAGVLTLAGLMGDLSESMLKRDADRKDSSSWLPGLGGVLDILDSMLAAAPAAYVCCILGVIGP